MIHRSTLYRDLDSDNDSITDILESSTTAEDLDGNGRTDDLQDTNANGVEDQYEISPTSALDTDGDGDRDAIDVDADADGISDLLENGGEDNDLDGRIDNLIDENFDGVDDTIEMFVVDPQDTDQDGLPDYRDVDSDGDGVSDFEESGAIDTDGDGRADELVAVSELPDADLNGVPDLHEANSVTGLATGVSGSGCSVSSIGSATRIDPTLLLLALVSLFLLLHARNLRA